MKKYLTTLAALLCCIASVLAQDAQQGRNRAYTITLNDVSLPRLDYWRIEITTLAKEFVSFH